MTTDAELGRIVDRHTIRFELRYPHGPEAVWRAITDPASLAVWFMSMELDLRVGGRVVLHYRGQPGTRPAVGEVSALEDGALLEYRFEKGPWDWPEGTLRFEVVPDDSGCRLVFTQSIAPDTVWSVDPDGQVGGPGTLHPGACAGWQAFFQEGLSRFLDGRTAPIYGTEDDVVMAQRAGRYRDIIATTIA